MRLTTLDRELTRLAPTPGLEAVDAARARVMAAVADDRRVAPAPDDGDDRVVPLDRARPARRVALRLGIAVSLAAASVAGITLWPHPTGSWVPAAYAGWRAAPEPVAPGEAQALADTCLAQVTEPGPDGQYPGPSVAGLGPVMAERRGDWTFVLLAASGGAGHTGTVLSCLLSSDGRGGISVHGGSTTDLPVLDEIAPLVAEGGGERADVWGLTGDNVARVTATLRNGTVVEATVSDGYFAAWWPSDPSHEGFEPVTLTWYLTDGTQGGTYDSPAP